MVFTVFPARSAGVRSYQLSGPIRKDARREMMQIRGGLSSGSAFFDLLMVIYFVSTPTDVDAFSSVSPFVPDHSILSSVAEFIPSTVCSKIWSGLRIRRQITY